MPLTTITTKIVTELTEQGWAVLDQFLAPELAKQLAQECRHQYALGQLRTAGIGRGKQVVVDKTVRGDQIRWLETGMSTSIDAYLKEMDQLGLTQISSCEMDF